MDSRVGAVQDVEQERFQLIGDFVHSFKIEGLKPGEGEVVFGIVE